MATNKTVQHRLSIPSKPKPTLTTLMQQYERDTNKKAKLSNGVITKQYLKWRHNRKLIHSKWASVQVEGNNTADPYDDRWVNARLEENKINVSDHINKIKLQGLKNP